MATHRNDSHGVPSSRHDESGPLSRSRSSQDEESRSDEPGAGAEDDDAHAGAQAPSSRPSMKWVYNSDHTDPVNFGYMQLVPVDSPSKLIVPIPIQVPSLPSLSRPPAVSGPSLTTRRPGASGPSTAPTVPSPTRGSRGSSITGSSKGSLEPSWLATQVDAAERLAGSLPVPRTSGPSANISTSTSFNPQSEFTPHQPQILPPTPEGDGFHGSSYSGQYSGVNQITTPPQSSYPQTSSSHSDLSQYELAYQPSPQQDLPRYRVPQQSTRQEEATWQQPVSQTLDHLQRSSYSQRLNEEASRHSFIDPISASPDGVVAYPPTAKRRYESPSPGPKAEASGSSDVPPSKAAISKRRRPINTTLAPSVHVGGQASICWRCQNIGIVRVQSGICDSCLQEFNLYIWPSTGAMRTENLESLVLCLLPSHMEGALLQGPPSLFRHQSWRGFTILRPHLAYEFDALTVWDTWTLASQQARSTGLWGDDFAALADIARAYQKSLPKPNTALEAAAQVLVAVCDLYLCFVNPNPAIPSFTPVQMIIEQVRAVRITLRNAFLQLQHLALSPSELRARQDWFPSFLSASILATTAITYVDILGACPSPYKEQIWGADWPNRVKEMRHGGYGMLISVLRANTNGINPLKMDCWVEEAAPAEASFVIETPTSYSMKKSDSTEIKPPKSKKEKKKKRRVQVLVGDSKEKERNVLLGYESPAAMEGLLAVKSWQANFDEDLKIGEDTYAKEMYAQAMMRPVASLWRIFDMK